MPTDPTRPLHVAASRGRGVLSIEWDDGTRCELPLRGLRAACPCAECRGGHEGMGVPGSPELLLRPVLEGRSTDLLSIQGVGNYGLQPTWSDGHSYGIYSWEYLRQLCPGGGA